MCSKLPCEQGKQGYLLVLDHFVPLLITYDPEKLERQGFKDISMDIQDREKIKVSAET